MCLAQGLRADSTPSHYIPTQVKLVTREGVFTANYDAWNGMLLCNLLNNQFAVNCKELDIYWKGKLFTPGMTAFRKQLAPNNPDSIDTLILLAVLKPESNYTYHRSFSIDVYDQKGVLIENTQFKLFPTSKIEELQNKLRSKYTDGQYLISYDDDQTFIFQSERTIASLNLDSSRKLVARYSQRYFITQGPKEYSRSYQSSYAAPYTRLSTMVSDIFDQSYMRTTNLLKVYIKGDNGEICDENKLISACVKFNNTSTDTPSVNVVFEYIMLYNGNDGKTRYSSIRDDETMQDFVAKNKEFTSGATAAYLVSTNDNFQNRSIDMDMTFFEFIRRGFMEYNFGFLGMRLLIVY